MRTLIRLSKQLAVQLVACTVAAVGTICMANAQIGSGPYVRFMGNNYSNGLATLAGPSTTATLQFSVTGSGNSVPVVAPNGKIVMLTGGGGLGCYSSTGTLIWSTTGWPYGSPTGDLPAIGSDNTVYVTQKTSGMSPTSYLVAYDLNATGPSAVVKWTAGPLGGFSGPFFAGSPVVGPDNTVYCIDSHSMSSGPFVFACKQGSGTNNVKWTWTVTTVDPSIYAGFWSQPALYTSGTTAYLVLSGTLSFGPTYMNYQTGTVRVAIVQDSGTGGTYLGHYDFPYFNPTMTDPVPPRYAANGAASVSPNGTKVVVPWKWSNSATNDYGIACLSVNIPAGTIGLSWPTLPSDVHSPPPSAAIDSTNPSTAYPYMAAMDSTSSNAYCTTAAGTSLLARRLSDGVKLWQTAVGSVIGAQLPALDSANAIWIGTNDGHVIRYNTSGTQIVSVNVLDPVNLLSSSGIGTAIGTGNYLYVTTTNTSTGVVTLRGVK